MNRLFRHIFPQLKGRQYDKHIQYISWSSLSNVISGAESVISTHAMLSITNNEEHALTYNYISKDIIGQLGGLYYMSKMGIEIDKNTKHATNKTLALQQVSIFMESASPLIPLYLFIPWAGIANIGKNISFISMGAVNAKVIQKLFPGQIGEIYAKIGAVNTLGSTVGMGIGLAITAMIPDHNVRLSVLPILSLFRVYTFKKSIKGIVG